MDISTTKSAISHYILVPTPNSVRHVFNGKSFATVKLLNVFLKKIVFL